MFSYVTVRIFLKYTLIREIVIEKNETFNDVCFRFLLISIIDSRCFYIQVQNIRTRILYSELWLYIIKDVALIQIRSLMPSPKLLLEDLSGVPPG